MADATLLPCPVPWCAQQDAPHTYQDCTDQWVVICPSCGVNGPVAMTEELAKETWFYLPRPPQLPSDDGLIKALENLIAWSPEGLPRDAAIVALSRHKAPLSALQVTEGDKMLREFAQSLAHRDDSIGDDARAALHSKQEGEG